MANNINKNNDYDIKLKALKEEYKDTIKQLEKIEEELTPFFHPNSRSIYIADQNKKITFVNQALSFALGYEKEEMLGMTLEKIFDKISSKKILNREKNTLLHYK